MNEFEKKDTRKNNVLAILAFFDRYMTIAEISEETELSNNTVLDCCRRLFADGLVDFKKNKNKRKKLVDKGLKVIISRKGLFFVLENFKQVFYDEAAKSLRIFYLRSDKSVREKILFNFFNRYLKNNKWGEPNGKTI